MNIPSKEGLCFKEGNPYSVMLYAFVEFSSMHIVLMRRHKNKTMSFVLLKILIFIFILHGHAASMICANRQIKSRNCLAVANLHSLFNRVVPFKLHANLRALCVVTTCQQTQGLEHINVTMN